MDAPYTLKTPLERKNGDMVTQVERVRDATGADLLLVDQYGDKPVRLTMELIAALAVLPEGQGSFTYAEVLRLSAKDIDALGEFVMAVLPDSQVTGATG